MLSDPVGTMSTFRALGVRMVRIVVIWAQIAPQAQSRTAPRGFNAADPASYPAANWAPYDEMVELAHADGLAVDLTLSGGAPRWAEGPGIPARGARQPVLGVAPVGEAFGQFARAVGERYSGTYIPPGQTSPLPRVSFWAIWNEPNFGEDLGPQAIDGSTVSVAPGMYRGLASQMWNSLQATGHGHDTILIGETAPLGLNGARATRPPPGPARELRTDQAAAVPADAVLRRLELPGAAGTRRPGGRLPGDGRGLTELPQAEPGAVQGERIRRPPVSGQLSPDDRALEGSRHRVVPADPEPRARAGPAAADLRLGQALPDLQHRVRLHHPPPEPRQVRLAGDRRVLHQLGRVPQLEAAADRQHHAVPAVRPDLPLHRRHRRRRLRERPGVLQRQAQARRTRPTACRCTCR